MKCIQITEIENLWDVSDFWTRGLLEGVLSYRPCPSVRGPLVRPSIFKYLRDVHWFFLIFCMKLEHHKGTKETEPENLWGHKWGKIPILEVFLMFLSTSLYPVIKSFWNFIYIVSSTLSNILTSQHYLTACSGKIWFWLYSRDQTPIFETVVFSAFLVFFYIMWVVMR